MAAHFRAALFVPLEPNKLKRNKLIHISLPLLPTTVLAPCLLTLSSSSASPLEHFALMKSCHVSSVDDGLKEYKLLRDLWHSIEGGGIADWQSEDRRCVSARKRPRDVIDAAEPQPLGKSQSG